MTASNKHDFEVGLIQGGRYAAISTSSPYFCFVTETLEEAEQKAKRALNFYYQASGSIVQRESSDVVLAVRKSAFRKLENCAA